MKNITSTQNKLIKYLLHLQSKSSFRRKEGRFVVEGKRELKFAFQGGYKIEKLFFVPEFVQYDWIQQILDTYKAEPELIQINMQVYRRLAYRDSTEGVIGLGISKRHDLSELKLSDNPLLLIAENIEKPGNIGAMIRTADAAALDALIIANPVTDLYNPNIIRSSIGGVFTVNIATASSEEVADFLSKHKIRLFAATLQNSNPYYEENFTEPTAIAVGSEAEGLTQILRKAAYKNIIIPMEGNLDSLNVSVSAAVLIFEAKRQRKKLQRL